MNNIINTITDKISGFINFLKADKKRLLIFIAAIVLVFVFIFLKGCNKKEPEVPGFGNKLSTVLDNSFYNGSGTLSICNNEFDLSINKANDNLQMGIKNPNVDYSGLVTRYNSAVYLNYSVFENKSNIVSIRKTKPQSEDDKEAPAEVSLKTLLIDILNSEFLTYTETENTYTATISNSENWGKFFSEAETKLTENKDNILQFYTDASPVKAELENLRSAIKTIGSSTNDANSLVLVLSYDEEKQEYVLSIDISLDYNALPSFINEKDFDTNKFTVYSTITYTFNENTVNIPSGSVKSISNETINGFITDCWNSLFERKNYITRSVVTEKADSVQNIINLGNTKEIYQYLFDKEGVIEGTLTVFSTDSSVLDLYIAKYSQKQECARVYNSETQEFSITLDITGTGINSLNKIATTPHGLAEYLKTAEGVVPIV